MILTWLVGFHGLTNGVGVAAFLRSGKVPDVQAMLERAGSTMNVAQYQAVVANLQLQALAAAHRITFPLAVAEILLSGLLVIASGLAMTGRRGARSLALQALTANALLTVVSFFLTRRMWAGWLEEAIRITLTLPTDMPERAAFIHMLPLRDKLQLVEVVLFGLGVFALTRGRAKRFFDVAARMSDGTDAT